MEYRQEPQKETNVRYVLDGGEFRKMYLVKETNNGCYLRKKKILDVSDRPKFFEKYLVYTSPTF